MAHPYVRKAGAVEWRGAFPASTSLQYSITPRGVPHGSNTQVAGKDPEAILQLIMEPGGTELAAAGKPGDYANESLVPAFLFDLGRTLVDSVYQHVLARR